MEYIDGPFPRDVLVLIRQYPGNQKCCDCSSLDTDWGNINHGTLHCLECAGRHRRFGVQVSFIRSIYMDTWNPQQIEMMKQGGNGQLREFFKKFKVDESPISTRYLTQAAEYYRHLLSDRVSRILSGDIPSEPYRKNVISDRLSPRAIVSTKPGSSSQDITSNIHAYFEEGSLGLTLTRDSKQMAVVSKLVVGGSAQLKGVHVGDVVSGVNYVDMSDYYEILKEIRASPRPLFLTFIRHQYPPISTSAVAACPDQPPADSPQSPKTSILASIQEDNIHSLPVSLTIIDKSAHLTHISRLPSLELTGLDSSDRIHSIRTPPGRNAVYLSKGVSTNPSTEDSSINTFLFSKDTTPRPDTSGKSTHTMRYQKLTISAPCTPLTISPDSPGVQLLENSNEQVINSINEALGSPSILSSPRHIYTSNLFSPLTLQRNVLESIQEVIDQDASTAFNYANNNNKLDPGFSQENFLTFQHSTAENRKVISNIFANDSSPLTCETASFIPVLDDCRSAESSESNSSHGWESLSSPFSQKQTFLSPTPPFNSNTHDNKTSTFEKDTSSSVNIEGLETYSPLKLHDIFLRSMEDNQYHRERLDLPSDYHEHRPPFHPRSNIPTVSVELKSVRSQDSDEVKSSQRDPSKNGELSIDEEHIDSHLSLLHTEQAQTQVHDIVSWDAADDPDAFEENCVITSLEDGMKVKVWRKAQRKWKSATIVSIHGDHTLTVKFRNGAIETHVSLERIGLTTISHQASNDTTDNDNQFDQHSPVNTLVLDTDKCGSCHDHERSPSVNPNRDYNSNHDHNNIRSRYPNTQLQSSIGPPFRKAFSDDDLYSFAAPYVTRALRAPVGDYRVTFTGTPLGLSLEATTEIRGVSMITVSKLAANGQAELLGVQKYDSLIGVESVWVDSLDHALSILTTLTFPVTLVFRRFV